MGRTGPRPFKKFFILSFRNALSDSLTGEIELRNESSKSFCTALNWTGEEDEGGCLLTQCVISRHCE